MPFFWLEFDTSERRKKNKAFLSFANTQIPSEIKIVEICRNPIILTIKICNL